MCAATHLLIPRTFSSCLSLLSSLYSKREFVSLGCCCCKYMTQHSFYDCEKTIQSCGVHSTASSSGTLSAKCTGDENTVKCNSFVCVCKNTHTHTYRCCRWEREDFPAEAEAPPDGDRWTDRRTNGRRHTMIGDTLLCCIACQKRQRQQQQFLWRNPTTTK